MNAFYFNNPEIFVFGPFLSSHIPDGSVFYSRSSLERLRKPNFPVLLRSQHLSTDYRRLRENNIVGGVQKVILCTVGGWRIRADDISVFRFCKRENDNLFKGGCCGRGTVRTITRVNMRSGSRRPHSVGRKYILFLNRTLLTAKSAINNTGVQNP